MVIDKKTHKLNRDNYRPKIYDKHQIIVGHTSDVSMRHVIGWENRLNGKYKNTAAFTIDNKGKVFQHYDPKYYSEFLKNEPIDKYIISIVLENEGWLTKIEETNQFLNWNDDIYEREDKIVEKKWRDSMYWAPYSTKQLNSLVELTKYLCNAFDIPLQTIGHNTKVDAINDYNGVVFRSNYDKNYTDLSPAFNYNMFKKKLELI
jgi:N-acetyl-anhydromuramyl-L-alanine amidase AmpD